MKSKVLTILGVLIAIILLGVGLGLFLTRAPSSTTKSKPKPVITETTSPQTNMVLLTGATAQAETVETNDLLKNLALDENGMITNWDDMLDDILTDDKSSTDEKAQAMLKMFPRMGDAGRAESVRHLSNLLLDDDYPPMGRYLADPKTGPATLDELMTDVLNRPNSMKLPLLLEVARNPNHSKAAEARETLLQYLEKDEPEMGNDWNMWKDAVDAKVKEDP